MFPSQRVSFFIAWKRRMYTQRNATLKGEGPKKQGNVASYFENYASLIQPNDGTRSFIIKTSDCHDQAAPFNQSQETMIRITHSDHQISQISDGFMTFKVELQLQLTGIDPSFDDPDHLCKLFVGWKSSNQILDQLQIVSNNLSTGYQQNECIREGFAYSTIKPYTEKKTRRYIHSLYENVKEYSPSICGIYINVDDFKDGLPHTVTFEANLPFDDILALQAFDLFPNSVCGDIELKFYVKPKGLVWCMIDPEKVKDYKEVIQGDAVGIDVFSPPTGGLYEHAFTQIENSANIITNMQKETVETVNKAKLTRGKAAVHCTAMRIMQLKSTMFGFNVSERSLAKIREVFTQPQFIPSQKLEYNAFPLAVTNNLLQSTINMPLSNCTCISIAFPRHDNDYTVFENPFLQNLQLTINGRNVPDEAVSSTGPQFLHEQLVASDLDGGLQTTKEYEDSLTMTRNNETTQARFENKLSDNTSFLWNVQLERNGAGYCWDGFDSAGMNIPIQIKGNPIYSGGENNVNNTYYVPEPDTPTYHPPPPQIWSCSDTYFVATTEGLRYVDGAPPGSQAQ